MFKLIVAAVSAAVLLFGKPASASVTFDFFETAITACRAVSCGPQQFSPPFPILMTLQLSGTTETGSAEYNALAFPRFGPVVSDPILYSLCSCRVFMASITCRRRGRTSAEITLT
jgi:hypothetical protein